MRLKRLRGLESRQKKQLKESVWRPKKLKEKLKKLQSRQSVRD